ncbi:hypothetical protein [Microbacterium lushaniae]|uniref:hypothetical protein n=1 Tax=Microbacterium lushaniae TaxID=2614639 RepID=UPI00177CD3CF|nr:hypothetical protein [Microbacterium lushaniae]
MVVIPALRPVAARRPHAHHLVHAVGGSSLRATLLIYGAGAALLLIWQTALVVR